MTMKSILALVVIAWGLAFVSGCDPIREPWVQNPDQLAAERARPEAVGKALNHRLRAVQTDR